jgi:haloalkane dehalogenase
MPRGATSRPAEAGLPQVLKETDYRSDRFELMPESTLSRTEIDGLEIAYRDEGEGEPVLLLHGWPTSSFLWRDVIPVLAEGNRVIAPDLPGFGESSKPLDRRYDFELFETVLDGLLAELEVEETGLAVHDLGGPIGVHWAIGRPGEVTRLALLNTLLYPDFDPSVAEFVIALLTPEKRDELTSPEGLAEVLGLGLADDSHVTERALAGIREPFRDEDSRLALANAGIQLPPDGFAEIATGLRSLDIPVCAIYGEEDRILPDVAETMSRVDDDVPGGAEITGLPGCGHFLQEEAPGEVGELLAEFFS